MLDSELSGLIISDIQELIIMKENGMIIINFV